MFEFGIFYILNSGKGLQALRAGMEMKMGSRYSIRIIQEVSPLVVGPGDFACLFLARNRNGKGGRVEIGKRRGAPDFWQNPEEYLKAGRIVRVFGEEEPEAASGVAFDASAITADLNGTLRPLLVKVFKGWTVEWVERDQEEVGHLTEDASAALDEIVDEIRGREIAATAAMPVLHFLCESEEEEVADAARRLAKEHPAIFKRMLDAEMAEEALAGATTWVIEAADGVVFLTESGEGQIRAAVRDFFEWARNDIAAEAETRKAIR